MYQKASQKILVWQLKPKEKFLDTEVLLQG